jgi:hypothetical protein
MTYVTPKIPKFCMLLYWVVVNNFLNCADMHISIYVELKFLEQIHNFWKNLINSPKSLLDMDFTKENLVGITCM